MSLLPLRSGPAWAAARRARRWLRELPYFVRVLPTWITARRRIREWEVVTAADAAAARRSDRVFIFGSGASLNKLSAEEWGRIAEHDTFGFNWFVREDFVRCDFQLIRQIADSNEHSVWEPQIREYCELIARSAHFRETILLIQYEWRGRAVNLALEHRWLPKRRLLPWTTSHRDELSSSFAAGLAHGTSTLTDTVNAAVLLGWKEIVLVGVDLYDRRYFWAPSETRSVDRMRGASASDLHTQASSGFVERVGSWRRDLEARGVSMSVHNPKSLLASVLPVFSWPDV
jgi:hypothetical protein